MADGKEPRKHSKSLANLGGLQSFENAFDNYILQLAQNRLATDLLNEKRKDDYNFQNEVYNYQMDQQIQMYERQKMLYGMNAQAVDMEVQFQKDQIYSNVDARLQELSYQQQDLDNAYARDAINHAFEQGNLQLAIELNKVEQEQRENTFNTNLKINENQRIARNDAFGAGARDAYLKNTAQQAQGRRELLKQSLQTQAQAGSAAASGRRGQSAAMLEQSIEAVASIDHAALLTQLENGHGSFANVTTKLISEKNTGDKAGRLERKQLKDNYKTETKANKLSRDQLKNTRKRNAQLFGLTVEEYKADTEKLGRMMIDTYSSIDSQLNRLAQKEFQTRIDLYSKMPLPPTMPPRAKPPRKIPYDKYAMPTPPPFQDKNTIPTTPQPQRQSGLSSFLSIAGALTAGAGTILTAGAGAGLFGATAGLWGTGLGTGGSILQGLAKATF